MVLEAEKWSGIRIRDRITTKSYSVLPTGRPNHNTKFQWDRMIIFAVILHTNKTEWQKEWHTNQPDRIASALAYVTHHFV